MKIKRESKKMKVNLDLYNLKREIGEEKFRLVFYIMKYPYFLKFKIEHLYHFIISEYIQENVFNNIPNNFIKFVINHEPNIYRFIGQRVRDVIYKYLDSDPLLIHGFMYLYITSYINMYKTYDIPDELFTKGIIQIPDEVYLLLPHIRTVSLIDYKSIQYVFFQKQISSGNLDYYVRKMDPYVLNYLYKELKEHDIKKILVHDIAFLRNKIGLFRLIFLATHLSAALEKYRDRAEMQTRSYVYRIR